MDDILNHAISKCPFLGEVARRQGKDYARCIALDPTVPVATAHAPGGWSSASSSRRPVLEEYDTYETTFRAFHGSTGERVGTTTQVWFV